MIKAKGFRLTLYIILVAVLISCFSILAYNMINSRKQTEKNLSNVSAYTIGIGRFYFRYQDTTVFEVNNEKDWKELVQASSYSERRFQGDYPYSLYPYNFQDKTINIKFDLFFNAAEINNFILSQDVDNPFRGTINGNSNKIIFPSTPIESLSFCRYNSGTIKNLLFVGYNALVGSDIASGKKDAGPVATLNNGTIESCIVENCSFLSSLWDDNCFVGAIAGHNSGTIKNCMVKGVYSFAGEDDGVENEGVTAEAFVGTGTNATSSIFCAEVREGGNPENNTNHIDKVGGFFDPFNYASCSSAFEKMGEDILSTSIGETGTPWFKYDDLSHGFGNTPYYSSADGSCIYYYNVYLRAFIEWEIFSFNSENTSMGSVSKSSITVPKDYCEIIQEGRKITAKYSKEYCTATAQSGFSFSHWTNSGTSYTAHFTSKICDIVIFNNQYTYVEEKNLNTGASKSYLWFPNSGKQYEREFKVAYGAYVNTTLKEYDKEGCCSAIVHEFTDIDGVSWQVSITTDSTRYLHLRDKDYAYLGKYKIERYCGFALGEAKIKSYNITFG